MDELIEVRNCAESYLENAKYHLLHGGYEKALSFANLARDEIDYIIKHASQQSVQATAATPRETGKKSNGKVARKSRRA